VTEAPTAAGRASHQRLARERFIWRFRAAAASFVAVQNLIEPGDSASLSWVIFAAFAASVVATGVALTGEPATRRVTAVGWAAMACDVAVVVAIMANNLTDPAEPIYLIGVLAMLEATMRWRRWGGIAGGVAAGLAAGTWTVVVTTRALGEPQYDYASMRAGVVIGLGVFLGSLVRRVSQQHDHLQTILDTSRDLIVTIGLDGRVQSANAASAHILGWTPEQLVGRPYKEIIHPDDLRNPDTPLRLGSDETVLFERRVRCRGGAVRWLELNASGSPGGDLLHVSARDVTERREARRRIEESEQRFRSLFEHNTDAVYAIDLEGRYTMVNPAAVALTGYPASDLVGMSFREIVDPDDLGMVGEHFDRAAAGDAQTYETLIRHRDGSPIELDVTNVPIIVDGEIAGVFGIAKDVTERRRLERQLGHQATHDALTGLPNRAHLETALGEEPVVVTGERILLFIDLDRFKLVNDSLGHRSGDEVLVTAVERLQRHVRSGDLLARWAGDEFCVLLAEQTSEDEALVVADRLRAVLAEPFAVAGREVRLSASIGLAASSPSDVERLVQIADLAMYQAKRAGRDRVAVYAATSDAALTQLDLEAELAAAIDREDVTVHYQPIVATSTGAVHGVEALVRWPQPDGTIRMPDEFVPIAEESGLIRLLTRHVIRDACRQLQRWREIGAAVPDLQVWVNISVVDLESTSFAEEVRATLDDIGIDPAQLVLEVTETMLMRDAEQVRCTVEALSAAGVALAMDDFGTGYSSLSQLHRLPVAACKVDREFVSQAPERMADAVILRALVDVGMAFGLPVVAEGIERPEELAAVAATGCPLAQGYLLGVPGPPEHLDGVLRAGRIALPDISRCAASAVPSAG
jgi:diguanylate cyclase (GGDEF)-like protein/PAS domain S-box-containing protein